jgi:8-oxo-dGTP diphosphatase
LNIRKKIREVDEYLQKTNEKAEIIESHPEMCFKYLNEGKVVMTKKSSETGIAERLRIISQYDNKLVALYEKMMKSVKRKDAKAD